jgi:hypothetical protein
MMVVPSRMQSMSKKSQQVFQGGDMMTDLDNRQPQINTQNLIDTASKLVAGDKAFT